MIFRNALENLFACVVVIVAVPAMILFEWITGKPFPPDRDDDP
jgi:hypothetical protein